MNTSTPDKDSNKQPPPSPQDSPLADSGFDSRGPVHLSGLTFRDDDTVVKFKGLDDDSDNNDDDNTTVIVMGDIADLQAANAALSKQLQDLVNQVQQQADLTDVVADLRRQVSDARKEIGDLSTTGPPSADVDKLCAKLSELATSMTRPDQPPAPRPSTHRGPTVTLPRFDGSVYSSFEKWQRDLEVYFDYFNWPAEDVQRLNAIPTILDGYARVRFFELTPEQRQDYASVMTALSASFAMSTKNLSFRRNYIRRKQKHSESVREFSADILQRFAECNPPLETQVDTYCCMLLPEIAAEIQDDNYSDMRSLVSCAERAEHRLRLRREARDSVNPVSFRPRRSMSRGRSNDRYYARSSSRTRDASRSRSRHDRSRSRPSRRDYRSPPPGSYPRSSSGSYQRQQQAEPRDGNRYDRRPRFRSQSRERSRSRPRHDSEANVVDTASNDLN